MLDSDDFLMGVSLSGFQFEMGGKERDTGTDWYRWCTDEINAYSGLVSGDSPSNGPNYWENYEKFHDLAQEAGMDAIRIGIEWSRVFPEETFGLDFDDLGSVADTESIDHYGKIIRDLKDRGITVMVDLNHFTLPMWAHDPLAINRNRETDQLGWAADGLPEEFAKYARFTVKKLDEYVDYWSTMNEPNVVAELGYLAPESGFPPSIISPQMYEKAFQQQIEAHNLSYEAMKKETDKPVGLIYSTVWFDGDETAEHAFAYNNFRFLDPIMDNCDFLGVNYYTRGVVERREKPIRVGSQEIDWRRLPGYGYGCEPNGESRAGRAVSNKGWEFYPEGLAKVLRKLDDRYDKPMFVTENGIADALDRQRPLYLLAHLEALESFQDRIDLNGYFHWSLVDNFEWADGFSQRFGLVHVNFDEQVYSPRPSYYVYREVIARRNLEPFRDLLESLAEDQGYQLPAG